MPWKIEYQGWAQREAIHTLSLAALLVTIFAVGSRAFGVGETAGVTPTPYPVPVPTSADGCLLFPIENSIVHLILDPECGVIRVGQALQVFCHGSTGDNWSRGGGFELTFDPSLLKVLPSSAAKVPESPFDLLPPPQYLTGKLQVAFLKSSMAPVSYAGNLFSFSITAMSPAQSASVTAVQANTRWATVPPPHLAWGASYTILDNRQFGDFDNTLCTDLSDALLLYDRWNEDFNGVTLDILDFLNLLDNWNQGPGCD